MQTRPSSTRMVGAGTVNSLLWTFLRLRKTCKHASMSITSDSDSDNSLTVSLKMVLAGHADQAPRKGGRQSNSRERGPGTRVPSPGAPSVPSAPSTPSPTPAPGPAPVPARRARRHRERGALAPSGSYQTADGALALLLPHRSCPGSPQRRIQDKE